MAGWRTHEVILFRYRTRYQDKLMTRARRAHEVGHRPAGSPLDNLPNPRVGCAGERDIDSGRLGTGVSRYDR